MWILPSRSRPQNLQRLIDAWMKTQASTPVRLYLDFDDPCWMEYQNIKLPVEWSVIGADRTTLSNIYNDSFRSRPDCLWYGFISDDVVPITNKWDIKLIKVAGNDGMAIPAGGETTGGCPHFVLGGDLVRSMGWLSLPGLDRIYIDTVWGDAAKARGVLRQVPDVILEHRHFSNAKALMDSTYRKHHKAQDKLIYDNWRKEHGYLS